MSKGLNKWFKENWVDIGAPKKGGGYEKCGRAKADGSGRPYPKCVPAAKAASMSGSQRRSAVIRKRAAGNVGPKPTNVKTIKASEGKMLKGKQKKLDTNKDGKISGEDFAMLKNVRMQKKDAMGKKVVKAESGKMITEAEAPTLGGIMGAAGEAAAPAALDSDRISEVDKANAERAIERVAIRRITPKQRRAQDIAIRAKKKMGGGMMQEPMGMMSGGISETRGQKAIQIKKSYFKGTF